jgi:hypothetical protein
MTARITAIESVIGQMATRGLGNQSVITARYKKV